MKHRMKCSVLQQITYVFVLSCVVIGVGQDQYTSFNQFMLLNLPGAYNLAGHTGEILFRLSNSGDPVLNLASLEITGVNVPEPAGAALLLMMSALGLRRRRRAA